MTLQAILQSKGSNVYTIRPSATLEDVVDQLVENNCGSLVVVDEHDASRVVGIITERDILRACAARRAPLDQTPVAEAMTKDLCIGRIDQSVEDTMGLMTERRVRHLPVFENDRLVGIISIGDVVKYQHHQLSAENHHLKAYIQS